MAIHTEGMSGHTYIRFATEEIRYATEAFGILNRMSSMGLQLVNLSHTGSPHSQLVPGFHSADSLCIPLGPAGAAMTLPGEGELEI